MHLLYLHAFDRSWVYDIALCAHPNLANILGRKRWLFSTFIVILLSCGSLFICDFQMSFPHTAMSIVIFACPGDTLLFYIHNIDVFQVYIILHHLYYGFLNGIGGLKFSQ